MHPLRPLLLLVCTLPLAGCAIFEALGGMPLAKSSFSTPPATTTSEVLDCAAASVTALRAQNEWWRADVTLRDDARGLLETGRYTESNIAGLRVRVRYDAARQQVRLELKGGGPYYHDLGVAAGMAALESKLKACTKA